jgi:pimeloyl-ACP methyl ester carboxylesterase
MSHERVPLVLLPGMLCDAAYWQPQARDLADICEVTIPTYGSLDTINAMAMHVLRAAPERFVVCGHSMGGRIVFELCAIAPERVLGIGLFGTDYRAPATRALREAELQQLLRIAERAEELGMEQFSREWALKLLPVERHGDSELIASVAEMVRRQSPAAIRAQSHAGAMRADYTELLPRIAVPALVCAGELDVLRPIEPHQAMARALPEGTFACVRGAGHMMSMERPRETSAVLRDWLDRSLRGRRNAVL